MQPIEYTVRESRRARNISLTVSHRDGLVVVIPPGFDRRLIPGIVDQKEGWIRKHLTRMRQERPDSTSALPDELRLLVVNEVWRVSYRQTAKAGVSVLEHSADKALVVSGDVQNKQACQDALVRWLKRRARRTLGAAVSKLAVKHGFHYDRVSIRGQKTRWGSCSSSGTLSLNYKLLFLPPGLVRYVLVHELCHTVEMNHSAAFWQLVASCIPDYVRCKRELRDAARFIPGWIS